MKVAIALSLSVLAVVALAGVRSDSSEAAAAQKKPAPAKTEVEPLTRDYRAKSTAPRASNKGPSLRCWQYGRLIFEEPMAGLPASSSVNGHRFEGRSGASVQLLDMHNSSCLIK